MVPNSRGPEGTLNYCGQSEENTEHLFAFKGASGDEGESIFKQVHLRPEEEEGTGAFCRPGTEVLSSFLEPFDRLHKASSSELPSNLRREFPGEEEQKRISPY